MQNPNMARKLNSSGMRKWNSNITAAFAVAKLSYSQRGDGQVNRMDIWLSGWDSVHQASCVCLLNLSRADNVVVIWCKDGSFVCSGHFQEWRLGKMTGDQFICRMLRFQSPPSPEEGRKVPVEDLEKLLPIWGDAWSSGGGERFSSGPVSLPDLGSSAGMSFSECAF